MTRKHTDFHRSILFSRIRENLFNVYDVCSIALLVIMEKQKGGLKAALIG